MTGSLACAALVLYDGVEMRLICQDALAR
jgi:hypothetical protein